MTDKRDMNEKIEHFHLTQSRLWKVKYENEESVVGPSYSHKRHCARSERI